MGLLRKVRRKRFKLKAERKILGSRIRNSGKRRKKAGLLESWEAGGLKANSKRNSDRINRIYRIIKNRKCRKE